MKTKKEKVIRNFLRMVLGIAIIGLAVNCPKLGATEAYASSTVNVKLVGRSWYGAAKLIVEEINRRRVQRGAPAYTLDADLQEWATQMSAEMLFYPDMATSNIRPDGTSMKSTLITRPMVEVAIKEGSEPATSDSEFFESFDRIVPSYLLDDTFNTSIGIGLYQEKAMPKDQVYMVFLLSNGNTNKGNYKSTVKTEVRTVSTLPSNFKLCNGQDGGYILGHETDKITLKEHESDMTTIFQHSSDGSHVMLDNTQASYKVTDPSIVSVIPTVDGIKLTGLRAGTTTFTATLNGQTVKYSVTVKGNQGTSSKKPSVKNLKDLPKNYQGLAIVGGEEVYVKNQKKYSGTCKINGKTYLYKNGKKFTGTKKGIYYKGGVKYTGWKKKGGKKYYYSKGKLVKNKFKTISGEKYYFNKSGIMQKGQVKVKGKYYYFNKSGVMQKNKWIKIKGYKYYFNKKGIRTKKKKA